MNEQTEERSVWEEKIEKKASRSKAERKFGIVQQKVQ